MTTTPSPPSAREMEPYWALISEMLSSYSSGLPAHNKMAVLRERDKLRAWLARREQPADGGAVSEAVKLPEVMRCTMIESDFEKDTILLRMQGEYWASAGVYALLKSEDYEQLTAGLSAAAAGVG